MRVLIIGHAYAASYNRRDKLLRIAKNEQVDELGVVIPQNWRDRMMKVDRKYEVIKEDQIYRTFLLNPVFSGSQSRHLYLPWEIYRVIKGFNPDLIHIEQEPHDWVTCEVALINNLFFHKPFVLFAWENIKRPYGLLTRLFRRFVISQIDYFIGGNKESIDLIKQDGYRKEATVIPQFGIDENFFHPQNVSSLKEKLGLSNKFVIGFVGRLVEEKGIQTLIESIKQLANRVSRDFILVILSSMAPTQRLLEVSKSLGDQVKFVTDIPHEDFPEYINTFDVLVLPSETQGNWKEQFGRVLIEAMACGVPVIGSSSGAIPEVVGEAGLIFEERNSGDLSQKIQTLMTDSALLEKLKAASRPHVLNYFTHQKIVDWTTNTWGKTLNYDKN